VLISVLKKLIKKFGFRIRHHPMAGLIYTGDSFCSAAGPKLLSTYEIEITGILHHVIASSPKIICDVGSADGFFAVGLAKALPSTRVIAYELDNSARDKSRELATYNRVADRIDFRGACDHNEFQRLLIEDMPDFVLMDIEGGEYRLLMDTDLDRTAHVRLLVEIHDYGDGTIATPIIARFSATHSITSYPAKRRSLADIPYLFMRPIVGILQVMGSDYIYERPDGMSWLDLVPKEGKSAGQQT
jgi:hypothetical protein